MRAARRARQIGATALQIFSDNPTAWRRRPEPPADAVQFVAYCEQHGIAPVAIHASYLVNLAGTAEPFASQSLEGLRHEVRRAPAYGASLVNTHIGSHRGEGPDAGLSRIASVVLDVLVDVPAGVRLVLENSAGGGDTVGSRIEELAAILDAVGGSAAQLAFRLDTAPRGELADISTPDGAAAVLDRFDALIGLDRLALIHLNDSKSALGSRSDRHEHLGAGRIGAMGLAAFLRDPRLPGRTTLVMETPGVDEGYDAVNLRRSWLLHGGADALPTLPAAALRHTRRSTRAAQSGEKEARAVRRRGRASRPSPGGAAVAVRLANALGAERDVGLHQLADIGLVEDVVPAQGVLNPRGRELLPARQAGEVARAVGLLADLAQPARQLGGGAERRHAVTLDQTGDGRVVDTRLERQLALAHLLFLQLTAKPAVERPRRLERHAPCPCAAAHRPVASAGGACKQPQDRSGAGAPQWDKGTDPVRRPAVLSRSPRPIPSAVPLRGRAAPSARTRTARPR
jgi:deoxyribonuclease-4